VAVIDPMLAVAAHARHPFDQRAPILDRIAFLQVARVQVAESVRVVWLGDRESRNALSAVCRSLPRLSDSFKLEQLALGCVLIAFRPIAANCAFLPAQRHSK
jgi:hypothetical protein